MVAAEQILKFVDVVAAKFRPQRIVLFGSYAYGTPTPDSDVDILVVKNFRGSSHDQAVSIRGAVPRDFPMDLLVRTEAEIRRRVRWNDYFMKEITEKGLVLYEADDPRVGGQGRRRLRRRLALVEVA